MSNAAANAGGGGGGGGGGYSCFKCGQEGHRSFECPNKGTYKGTDWRVTKMKGIVSLFSNFGVEKTPEWVTLVTDFTSNKDHFHINGPKFDEKGLPYWNMVNHEKDINYHVYVKEVVPEGWASGRTKEFLLRITQFVNDEIKVIVKMKDREASEPKPKELVAKFSFSYTVNEEEFNEVYKEEHGHEPPPSAFSVFVMTWSNSNWEDDEDFKNFMAEQIKGMMADLPVWNTVYNEPGEPFNEYCGDIPSLAKFKAYKYYATYGGGPEGGFIMKKVGDRVKVRAVDRTWHKPFSIMKTFYAKVSVKTEGESTYICVEPEEGEETDSD